MLDEVLSATGVRDELVAEGFNDYLSKPIEFAKMEEMFSHLFLSEI